MSVLDWLPWVRARRSAELIDELRAHLEMAEADRVARGETPRDAAANARREFGNVALVHEVARDQWGGAALERFGRDLQLAARSLRRAPAFTIPAVLTLALGIGLTTAIFGVVNGIVLRPLPFPEADRLVTLCEQYPGATPDWCGIAPPNVEDIAARSRAIEAIGIARNWSAQLSTADGNVMLPVGIASPGMFRALGVPPERGRALEPADLIGRPGHVAVISHAMWQARFGGAADIIGHVILLDKEPVTIVGVMPREFRVPRFEWVDLWRPLHIDPRDEQHRAWRGFVAYARLRDGVSVAAARADLSRIASALAREHFRSTPGWGITMRSLQDLVVGGVRRTLLLFLGAVVLVLLIACLNVANLVLARGTLRRRELALRAALGAGRGRLVRTLLTEGLLLAAAGAVLGAALAAAGTAAFRKLAPDEIPRIADVDFDGRVLGFALLLAVATTLIFGLLPALRAARADVSEGLRQGARTHTTRTRLGGALVVGELALALVLLTGAGLLTRTFAARSAWTPGFEQRHLLVFSLSASEGTYRTRHDVGALWARAEDALRAIPGVTAVGTASGGPVFGGRETGEVRVAGHTAAPEGEPVRWFDVSPGFFATLAVPLVRGRDLDARDGKEGAPPAVLVNETLARRYWPDSNPTGRRITVATSDDTTAFTVVGVVRDVPGLEPGTPVEPQLYWSNRQRPRWFTYVVVRTSVPPAGVVRLIRHRLKEVDPDLAPSAPRTMPELVAGELVDPRFFMLVLATFGLVALALAAVGTYGLLAYLVSQRRREIGIRLALGAQVGQVVRGVVREGLVLALLGLVIGGLASLVIGPVLRHLVAGVSTRDPLTLGTATVVLIVAALAACLVPARRAGRVDPTVALRSE